MKTTCIWLITLCYLTVLATVGVAQDEEIAIGNTFGVGARAMGMGGAFLGVADDFTALYWNPAGLAQIKKYELFGSLSHSALDAETQFTQARLTEIGRAKTRPNSIGLVYPFDVKRGGFALAFGYNRPQNFDSRIAIQGIDPSSGGLFSGLDVDETDSNTGGIALWSFGAGVFLSENILLGGSFDFWHGNSFNELESAAADVSNIDSDLTDFAFHDTVDRQYYGVSGRIGILAGVGEYVTVGLTAIAPTNLDVDEIWRQETVAVFDDGERENTAEDGLTSYELRRPFEFGAGVAVKLLEKQLILAGDIQFTDWTQTEYAPLPADDIFSDDFEAFYDSTIQVRVGAEYQIQPLRTNVRIGYFHDPIPFKGKDIDNDRSFVTFGVGKIFDEVIKLDIAYMRGSWTRSDNSLTTGQTSNRVFLSAAYRY